MRRTSPTARDTGTNRGESLPTASRGEPKKSGKVARTTTLGRFARVASTLSVHTVPVCRDRGGVVKPNGGLTFRGAIPVARCRSARADAETDNSPPIQTNEAFGSASAPTPGGGGRGKQQHTHTVCLTVIHSHDPSGAACPQPCQSSWSCHARQAL